MTPKSDIEIVREGLELADRQITIGLQKVEGVFIKHSLQALSNLSKQLEQAEAKYIKCCEGRAYLDEKIMRLERQVRRDTLEEAALRAENWMAVSYEMGKDIGKAIRGLKDKP